MHTKIQKWGNSQGLRLAKNVLEDARLGVGDEVDVAVRDGIIVIAPIKKIRGRYRPRIFLIGAITMMPSRTATSTSSPTPRRASSNTFLARRSP